MQKKFVLLLVIGVCSTMGLRAQSVTYSNLSYKYIYKITVVKSGDKDDFRCRLRLYVFKRDGKLLQVIDVDAGSLHDDDAFKSSKNSRSFITGRGRNLPVEDYDFGDLVIADLNFDGKEDIAVKSGLSADSGPNYTFYMQGNDGLFYIDNYLTANVLSFPKYINAKAKTITTQTHANVSQEDKRTFKYNADTKKWHFEKGVRVES